MWRSGRPVGAGSEVGREGTLASPPGIRPTPAPPEIPVPMRRPYIMSVDIVGAINAPPEIPVPMRRPYLDAYWVPARGLHG
ncbi:MAG: hypothetical protein ABI465_10230 [Ktedonobacteraceae bacterium]